MITCYIQYIIDPEKLTAFEQYAKQWISLVDKLGGTHLGYFLPHEGANNQAIALFNFPSLAAYEQYRIDSLNDDACQAAYAFAAEQKCIISYTRTFMKPILE